MAQDEVDGGLHRYTAKGDQTVTTRIALLTLTSICVSFVSGFSEEKTTVPQLVQAAIDASDACYHWAGEGGDQTPERNEEISKGAERDCPAARRNVTEAYRRFPNNSYLSLPSLKLNDIGYFKLSAAEKEKLCKRGVPLLKNGYYKSNHEDDLFEGFCPQKPDER